MEVYGEGEGGWLAASICVAVVGGGRIGGKREMEHKKHVVQLQEEGQLYLLNCTLQQKMMIFASA